MKKGTSVLLWHTCMRSLKRSCAWLYCWDVHHPPKLQDWSRLGFYSVSHSCWSLPYWTGSLNFFSLLPVSNFTPPRNISNLCLLSSPFIILQVNMMNYLKHDESTFLLNQHSVMLLREFILLLEYPRGKTFGVGGPLAVFFSSVGNLCKILVFWYPETFIFIFGGPV